MKNRDDLIYMPVKYASEIYSIPIRSIYTRINAGHYRRNARGDVCLEDIEKSLVEPIKRGRKLKNK